MLSVRSWNSVAFIEASLEELPVSANLGQSCLATKISAPGPSSFGWFRHTRSPCRLLSSAGEAAAAAPLQGKQPRLLPRRRRSSRARAAAPYAGRATAPREPAPLLPVQAAPQLPARLDCSHSPLAVLRAAHVSRSRRFPPPTPLAPPRASALAGPPAAKPERPRTRRLRAPRARGSCSRN